MHNETCSERQQSLKISFFLLSFEKAKSKSKIRFSRIFNHFVGTLFVLFSKLKKWLKNIFQKIGFQFIWFSFFDYVLYDFTTFVWVILISFLSDFFFEKCCGKIECFENCLGYIHKWCHRTFLIETDHFLVLLTVE